MGISLKSLFAGDPVQRDGAVIYAAAVEQARRPGFYAKWGVPDSLDGRFDMVALHVALVLRRLKAETDPAGRALGQAVFDAMFDDMDRSLREIGVGDLGVGKRVKNMARAYYGRAEAYGTALDAGDGERLAQALRRNLYRGAAPDAERMAAYVREAAAGLAAQPLAALRAGRLGLPPAPDDPG